MRKVEEYILPETLDKLEQDIEVMAQSIRLIRSIREREDGLRERGESYGFSAEQLVAFEVTASALESMLVERTTRRACHLLGRSEEAALVAEVMLSHLRSASPAGGEW